MIYGPLRQKFMLSFMPLYLFKNLVLGQSLLRVVRRYQWVGLMPRTGGLGSFFKFLTKVIALFPWSIVWG